MRNTSSIQRNAAEVRVKLVIRVAALAAAALLCACHSSSPAPPLPPGCVLPISNSALPSTQVIDLGNHRVGDQVSFNVPAGTGSITILHQAKVAGLTVTTPSQGTFDNSAVPLTITSPGGVKVYDDSDPAAPSSADGGVDSSGRYAMFGGGQPSTAAFTMPNTSGSLDAGIAPGNWSFVVNDYANECAHGAGCSDGGSSTGTYDVSVLTHPLPAGTNLDVNFYLVANGLPFDHSNAASNPSVRRMVQTYTAIFAAHGINVRNVNFHDVSPIAVQRFGTNIRADATGPCDELDQMFTLSSDNSTNTINLFLVQSIRQSSSGSSAGTVVGVDGSIPGPATLNGTVHSGAAVSLADLFYGVCTGNMNLAGCGADRVAYIAAHESGHFLGLFHTTEMEGDSFDPITDTPKCPCLSCAFASDQPKCGTASASGQPLVTAGRCVNPGGGCGGGDNLMFWLLDDTVSRGTLSAQQAAIMKLNPAVQ